MKIKEFKIPFNGDYFSWIDVEQPTGEKIEELAKKYNLYKIDTEDCQVPPQIPKLVEHYGYLFLVIEYPLYLIEEKETQFEELDIFVGKNYFLTLHSGKIPPYQKILKEIKKEEIKKNNPSVGNLLYFILRKLHLAYFPILDTLSNQTNEIKKNIFLGKEKEMVKKLAINERNLLDLRKIIKPQLEAMEKLEKRVEFFKPEEKMANKLEDLTEKAAEAWTILENETETIQTLEQTNNSLIQYKTNEIIVILTIFSVIMLPLTFIASIYSMNIPWVPLAKFPYVFWIICGIMITAVIGMLAYFKKKRWI